MLAYKEGAKTGTGGTLETPDSQVQIRHILPVATHEDLSKVTVTSNDGSALKLGDVANVVEGHPP